MDIYAVCVEFLDHEIRCAVLANSSGHNRTDTVISDSNGLVGALAAQHIRAVINDERATFCGYAIDLYQGI